MTWILLTSNLALGRFTKEDRMRVFDHIDPGEIDRREIHLRLLALAVICILALGLALIMYPAIFAKPMTLSGGTFQAVFFGFCTLSLLVIAYLVDRQLLISSLRRRIAAREITVQQIKQEASKDFLASLHGPGTLRDRLAMEFQRVSGAEQPLSLLVVEVKVQPEICNPTETPVVYADAGRALLRRIRGEDSLFLLASGRFGVLLPRISTPTAELMRGRFEEGLRDAAGLVPRFDFKVRLINYPDQVTSVREIIEAIHSTFTAGPRPGTSMDSA
jgi:GGDEF domain-containing protein